MIRRHFLQSLSCGFGGLAFSALAGQNSSSWHRPVPRLPARAKRVIFVFMQGGPSHVDTFDYKPLLFDKDGEMVIEPLGVDSLNERKNSAVDRYVVRVDIIVDRSSAGHKLMRQIDERAGEQLKLW